MRRTLASPVSSANILSCVFTNCHFQLLPDYDFLGISAPRLHVSTSDFRRSYLTFQFSPRRLVVYTGSSLFLSRCSNVGIGWSLNPWTQLLRQLCVSTVKLFALLWQSMVAAACCRDRSGSSKRARRPSEALIDRRGPRAQLQAVCGRGLLLQEVRPSGHHLEQQRRVRRVMRRCFRASQLHWHLCH